MFAKVSYLAFLLWEHLARKYYVNLSRRVEQRCSNIWTSQNVVYQKKAMEIAKFYRKKTYYKGPAALKTQTNLGKQIHSPWTTLIYFKCIAFMAIYFTCFSDEMKYHLTKACGFYDLSKFFCEFVSY